MVWSAPGTTAKQLDKETHARPIGYGGMIGESLLSLLAVLACTAGFASPQEWHDHYASFNAAKGLATKLGGFIEGTTSFLAALGLPADLASAIIAMVVVSFTLTTLDSTTITRFNIEELFGPLKIRSDQSLHLVADGVWSDRIFAFYGSGRKAGSTRPVGPVRNHQSTSRRTDSSHGHPVPEASR